MEERIKELSKYRFETCLENLDDARLIYIASNEEAQKQIARAEEFSSKIRQYLINQGIIQ